MEAQMWRIKKIRLLPELTKVNNRGPWVLTRNPLVTTVELLGTE